MKISLILATVVLLIFACERVVPFESLPPSIVGVFDDGLLEIIQEPGGGVLLDFNLQSTSGLKELQVIKDGELFDNIVFTSGEVSSLYRLEYVVPIDQPTGTEVNFNFQLTDQDSREVSSVFTIRVNSTFSEIEEVVNGVSVITVKGKLNNDFMFEAAKTYVIDSTLSVQSNKTLTIEKGSTVYFKTYPENNRFSRLVISRGSSIIAEGTAEEPIVFTSDKLLLGEEPSPVDWDGIYIYGSAPTNEGDDILDAGFRYGGNIPNQSSGILKYVRIEYPGKIGEHAIHFFGIGSGTLVENVQVFRNQNTSFRVKGGSVNLRYIAGIGHGGYGIWADHGWQGNGQFWLFQTDRQVMAFPFSFWNNARSLEMRNNDEGFFLSTPRTAFTIANVTLIGNGFEQGAENRGNRRGFRVRHGGTGTLQNAIITQFPNQGARIDDLALEELGDTMIMANIRSFQNQTNYQQEAETVFLADPQFNVTEEAVPGISLTNFVGSENSPFDSSTLGSWFISAPYMGAVENASNDWTSEGNWFKNLDGTIR